MKKLNLFALLFTVLCLSSCSVVGDIFKAGAYTGIIAVFIVIALIIWIISKF